MPPPLQRLLVQLAQARALGRRHVTESLVAGLCEAIAALPPQTVPQAGREMPIRAQLYVYDHSVDLTLLRSHPGLACLFLFHGSGYVREAALRLMDTQVPAVFPVCAVAYRLNDWVSQVRTAAAGCFGRLVATMDAAVLGEAAAYLLAARRHWQRGPLEIAVIDDTTSRDDVRADLVARMISYAQGAPQRILLAAAGESRLDPDLPRLMREARHPSVRALAALFLMRGEVRWPVGLETRWIDKSMGVSRRTTRYASRPLTITVSVDDTLAATVQDGSPQVRKVAMQAVIDAPDLWRDREPLICRLSADRSAVIRAGMDYIRRQQAKETLDPAAS
ncbi:hypothetical protein [Asticcacaulis sp. AC460]|uniref:hypothetical protein n=1 Tax=Asticcacaulis sp. AC460 TaxID=1282360 RepID=UPI0012DC7D40|nr:hypothetical protein [Asticcacaulis sp. AC460]